MQVLNKAGGFMIKGEDVPNTNVGRIYPIEGMYGVNIYYNVVTPNGDKLCRSREEAERYKA